jgi:transcriptional regulator with XRE-family HTH domain
MMKRTGNLIRARRKKLQLTQSQLGELMGVTQVSVSEWENGKSVPHDLVRLKRVLRIEPDEWLATMVYDDPVVRAIHGQTRLPSETRGALATIYQKLLDASDGYYPIVSIDESDESDEQEQGKVLNGRR